jgi:hypothetical protein
MIVEPKIIRPLIDHVRRQCDVVAASVVAAEDEQPASAGGAHLAEGDLLLLDMPHDSADRL